MSLSEYTTQELEYELEFRKTGAPEEIKDKDWSKVERQVRGIMDQVAEGGYYPDDDPHYLFEAVLETMYGREVWDWYNRGVC